MDIVVTGYAGFGGSIAIYNDKELGSRLKERYSESFFGVFGNAERTAVSQDVKATESTGLSELDRLYNSYREEGLAEDGAEGGVLAALWKVLRNNHKGGIYALRDIPVLQQTVEVCEMYSLNPYRLYAPGCRVWISTDTGAVARAAAAAGVPLNVIGFTSKGAAIRRTDTETDSSLRRPEGDELDKVLPAHSSILL